MRVLIAEDDFDSRRFLASVLTRWGYDVVAASHGAEAWEILQRPDTPRIAILDWLMPGLDMDGVQVVRRLRTRAEGPYVYLMMLTSRTQPEDYLEAVEAGADDYVTKPFAPRDLRVRLVTAERVLKLRAELEEAQAAATSAAAAFGNSLLGRCREALTEIRAAITLPDAAALQGAAESIKVFLGAINPYDAFNAADRLQAMGREGNLAGAAAASADLEQALDALSATLTAPDAALAAQES